MAVIVKHIKAQQHIHIAFAGALSIKDLQFAAKSVRKALHYPVCSLTIDMCEVMATQESLQDLRNFHLIDQVTQAKKINRIIYIVPGLHENPIGKVLYDKHQENNTLDKVTYFENQDEVQTALAELVNTYNV